MPAMIFISVDLPDPFAPQDADLGAGKERQINAVQNLLPARIGLGQVFHDIDVLIGGHGLRLLAAFGCGADVLGSRPVFNVGSPTAPTLSTMLEHTRNNVKPSVSLHFRPKFDIDPMDQ